jgi:predicted phage terminase large subunit-like protein
MRNLTVKEQAFDQQELFRLIKLKQTLAAELSLHEFLKQAWPWIAGKLEFVDGWHIQAICEHLEALYKRQIRNLLINIPPRCCKSTIISVAFPAWVWLHAPEEQFLCSSYAISLANRDSRFCRSLIMSPWYQENWGNRYQLLKDQNTKGRFDNNLKGYRLATSSKGSMTGEGGTILIADDPNNVQDRFSTADREARLEWLTQIWGSRLNNRETGCRVIVQQRMHQLDVSGYTISNDHFNEYTKLILPMEFESKRHAATIVLPSTNGKPWQDPRQEDKELLWPAHTSVKEIEKIKNNIGEMGFAGQYQQRPSPEGGGIIKTDWFKWWKHEQRPEIEFTVQSWDTAFSDLESACYSACTTWGMFYDENWISNIILLSSWKGRVGYPELREMAKRLYSDYNDTGKMHNPALKGRTVDMCIIEAKASGDPLIRDLVKGGVHVVPYLPKGNKNDRVHKITHLIEAGLVWLPAQPPNYIKLRPMADEFLEDIAAFPNAESNDVVDTMTQVLSKMRDMLLIAHPKDDRIPEIGKKQVRVY